MQNLLYNISQVLGITIIHSLWQGLIAYIALRLFLAATPAISSVTKYRVSYATLLGTLGWFLVTLFQELNHYNWLSTTALQITPLTLPAVIQEVNAPANQLYFTIAKYMPYLTMVYVVGVVFNTLKLALSWNSIYRIRQNITDAGFEGTVKRLSAKLNVAKPVKAAFSQWVDVPCVTGFIKPIILLPVTLTTYLSTDEIEAILMHELAHVKRNDYLFNFIQQVIGILLFFNPFARLIANIINEERENCCDDAVVQITGSPFIYAQALLKLEENKQQQWQLTLAAVSKKYELLNRIERIMKTKTQTINIRPVLITTLALTFAITSIAWLNPEIKDGKVVIKNAPAIKKVAAAIISSTTSETKETAKPKRKRTMRIADLTAADDTTKKKFKIVVEDENGVKTEYSSVDELPEADKNDFLKNANDIRLNIIDTNIAAKLRKYYASDAWKKNIEQAHEQGIKAMKQINSPEWKKKQKVIMDQAMAISKQFSGPKWGKEMAKLGQSEANLAKYFESADWKEKVTNLQKKMDDYKTSETKQKQLAIDGSAEDLAKFYDSAEWKKQMADLQKTAADMALFTRSPEFKKQMKEMQKAMDSPEFKKQMKESQEYLNSPEFKNLIKESADAMSDSKAGFKEAAKAAKKELKEAKDAQQELKAAQDSLNKVKP
ncbi:MAG: M56 family metallopeptidase [Bacteroidota bacterium]